MIPNDFCHFLSIMVRKPVHDYLILHSYLRTTEYFLSLTTSCVVTGDFQANDTNSYRLFAEQVNYHGHVNRPSALLITHIQF